MVGQNVVVRSHSSGKENWPTLEFQKIPNGDGTVTKVRYSEL